MSVPTDAAAVAARLARVRERLADAGADPTRVVLVAVVKGFGAGAVAAAADAGVTDVGDNYAQELVAKHGALGAAAGRVRWHFVGSVQRNKVRTLAPVVDLWETVDRAAVAREVAKRAPGAAVLVQVNTTAEATKGGCRPDDAPALVAEATEAGLDVRGLMTVGLPGARDPEEAGFAPLARLADRLGLPERSMGMTEDLELAARAGTTMVRVGRALFGPRSAGAGPAH